MKGLLYVCGSSFVMTQCFIWSFQLFYVLVSPYGSLIFSYLCFDFILFIFSSFFLFTRFFTFQQKFILILLSFSVSGILSNFLLSVFSLLHSLSYSISCHLNFLFVLFGSIFVILVFSVSRLVSHFLAKFSYYFFSGFQFLAFSLIFLLSVFSLLYSSQSFLSS